MGAPQNIRPHGGTYMSACYRLTQNLNSCTLLAIIYIKCVCVCVCVCARACTYAHTDTHTHTRSIQCVIYGRKKEMSSFF